jgi:hypothetical protein
MDMTPSHYTAERQLATPINLNTGAAAYVSVLVSQALDIAADLTGKPLNIQLRTSGLSTSSLPVGCHCWLVQQC